MSGLLDRLDGKTIAGASLAVGHLTLFFDDHTMLSVKVEPREHGEDPRDVIVMLGPQPVDTETLRATGLLEQLSDRSGAGG